jgi:hypothetical protein
MWFLDKLGWSGTLPHTLSGLGLIGSFFYARLVCGFPASYEFFQVVGAVRDQVPDALYYLYAVANVTLNLLNVYWFVMMVRMLRDKLTAKKGLKGAIDEVLEKEE